MFKMLFFILGQIHPRPTPGRPNNLVCPRRSHSQSCPLLRITDECRDDRECNRVHSKFLEIVTLQFKKNKILYWFIYGAPTSLKQTNTIDNDGDKYKHECSSVSINKYHFLYSSFYGCLNIKRSNKIKIKLCYK